MRNDFDGIDESTRQHSLLFEHQMVGVAMMMLLCCFDCSLDKTLLVHGNDDTNLSGNNANVLQYRRRSFHLERERERNKFTKG